MNNFVNRLKSAYHRSMEITGSLGPDTIARKAATAASTGLLVLAGAITFPFALALLAVRIVVSVAVAVTVATMVSVGLLVYAATMFVCGPSEPAGAMDTDCRGIAV